MLIRDITFIVVRTAVAVIIVAIVALAAANLGTLA